MRPPTGGAARVLSLAACLSFAPSPAPAQTDSARAHADSAHAPVFTQRDAWLAAGFVGATFAMMPFDKSLQERLQLPSNQRGQFYGDAAAVVRNLADPGTLIIGAGLYVTGRLTHDETMTDIGLHSTEAILVATVAGDLVKGVAGRARPLVDVTDPHNYKLGRGFWGKGDYQSFPSGHTLASFALAAELTAETGRHWPDHTLGVGVVTYSVATLAGISRMYNNAHWASDVVMGAGVGILSGIVVERYQHTHPGNWVDRVFKNISIAR
jgi:membrane-associated phospholipid phosphatase